MMKGQAFVVMVSLLFRSPLVASVKRETQVSASRVLNHLVGSDLLPTVYDAILNHDDGKNIPVAMTAGLDQGSEQTFENENDGPSLFHHDDRKLEFTEACQNMYSEWFFKDQALIEAYSYYLNGLQKSRESLAARGDACTSNDVGDMTCNFVEAIDGETEFRSACATARGRILSYSLDVHCTLTVVGGPTVTAFVDLPAELLCFPGTSNFDNCIDELDEAARIAMDDSATIFESKLAAKDIFTGVSCRNFGGDNIVVEENAGSLTEEEAVVDHDDGSGTASTRGTCWFVSIIMMVFLMCLVNDTIM